MTKKQIINLALLWIIVLAFMAFAACLKLPEACAFIQDMYKKAPAVVLPFGLFMAPLIAVFLMVIVSMVTRMALQGIEKDKKLNTGMFYVSVLFAVSMVFALVIPLISIRLGGYEFCEKSREYKGMWRYAPKIYTQDVEMCALVSQTKWWDEYKSRF